MSLDQFGFSCKHSVNESYFDNLGMPGLGITLLLKLGVSIDDDRWPTEECCIDPETPQIEWDEEDELDDGVEDIMYFPISYNKNVFCLNSMQSKALDGSSNTLESMSFDYGIEYDLPQSKFWTTCAPVAQILKQSSSSTKPRNLMATGPILSSKASLNHQEQLFMAELNGIVGSVDSYVLSPIALLSGQGYIIKKRSSNHGPAIFAPISQERGMPLCPLGQRNISPESFPSGEFFLRESVAYALDKASNGVFHVPLAIPANLSGIGDGLVKERIQESSGLGDVKLLEIDEVVQFRFVFDLFFYNGNCQAGTYGRGFALSRPSAQKASENASAADISEGSGHGTCHREQSLYFTDNAYILPWLRSPTQQLISSFAKHYTRNDRSLKKWSPHALDFIASIQSPREIYTDILTDHGFPNDTCDNVAMSIQIIQKSVAKNFSPWETIDFLYFQEYAFIFTAFSIVSRSPETGLMNNETWTNLKIVIDMALVTYYQRAMLLKRSDKCASSLHMLNMQVANYFDHQALHDQRRDD